VSSRETADDLDDTVPAGYREVGGRLRVVRERWPKPAEVPESETAVSRRFGGPDAARRAESGPPEGWSAKIGRILEPRSVRLRVYRVE
jgi:hypothetical protein